MKKHRRRRSCGIRRKTSATWNGGCLVCLQKRKQEEEEAAGEGWEIKKRRSSSSRESRAASQDERAFVCLDELSTEVGVCQYPCAHGRVVVMADVVCNNLCTNEHVCICLAHASFLWSAKTSCDELTDGSIGYIIINIYDMIFWHIGVRISLSCSCRCTYSFIYLLYT